MGYFEAPVLTGLLAKLQDSGSVLPLNMLGAKRHERSDPEVLTNFLNRLNLPPTIVWEDSSEDSLKLIEECILTGLKRGWITIEKRELFLCSCGKVEILDIEDNLQDFVTDRTIYTKHGETICCKLCNQRTERIEKDCMLLHLPEASVDLDIYPQYGASEFNELYSSYAGRQLLISRSTPRPLIVNCFGQEYNIDVDMCWMPFLHLLQAQYSKYVETLLAINVTIKQAVLSIMLCRLLESQLPQRLLVLPKLYINFGNNAKLRAEEVLSIYGPKVTQLFICQALGYPAKRLEIPSSLAFWISKSLEPSINYGLQSGKPTIEDLIQENIHANLPHILKSLRKGESYNLPDLYKWLFQNIES